ncbi:MAG: DUF4900 domain-containing protein [Candidatus Omnitrophica bacterium]|nr:DUF4900 domain-containing protein [Candidatus Omnitrophota bacterium]MBU2043815.1 DUF4900 domain-containing protein [Candidatus Omnitrophota bacterium]MBU2251747.1 DUF4900 domain-containing protein [Candidatus Omnitrophota bacterium]MBU2265592.1 DUF4900 domain-containing protein [Candidatus Omnitrophota bacterium]MBU2473153.1 DUF4900 domain-containing protein [Candidatus Omnitrophota bacterium]
MRKSIALVLACIVMVVLLVLIGALLSNTVSEKNLSDREKLIVQAVDMAEAGLNHGIDTLRNAILISLDETVAAYRNGNVFTPYTDADLNDRDSLDFLCAFSGLSYVSGSNDVIELSFDSSSLPQDSLLKGLGSYTGKIFIKKQRDASGNILEAYCPDPSDENTFIFPYLFNVEVTAAVFSVSKTLSLEGGEFDLTIQRANFARYALFTNHHRSPQGTTVWFTDRTQFYGPVHTNDRLSFANNPSGYFTDEVTQQLTKARFYDQGRSTLIDADSNPPYDVPTFEAGFQRGVPLLNLESAVTQSDLKTQSLGTMNEPGTNGIYVPNNGSAVTGGIYIRGDSNILMSVDGNDNAVYTITQGSVSKTITVDYTNSQTTVQEGVVSNIYDGIPDGVGDEGVIIFDKGNVTSLSGTVQSQSQVTVSSQDDIVISGHIRYQDYDTSPSLNAVSYANLLGILSWGGDVRIGSSAPSNLDVHAVIMAPHGIFTVDDYRTKASSGDVNLLGGVITDFYGPFGTFWGTSQLSGYGRNFIYDTRMLGAMSPPYYPTARTFTVVAPFLQTDIEDMGLIWRSH